MTPALPRGRLVDELAARTRDGAPALLCGPPGSGKTALLGMVAKRLSAQGWQPVYLDLMTAASCPDRLVHAALEALPADGFADRLPAAVEMQRLATSGRANGARAVNALLGLWARLAESGGRPVALLFDEATEVRSLAYYPGLRQVSQALGRALSERRRGTLLATSYPTQAAEAWPQFERLDVPRLSPEELAGVARERRWHAEAVASACDGRPGYARALLDAARNGDDLVTTWAREMARGGRLEASCRATWETLLLRSRGYGMSKAVLDAVAREEGLNLTALVSRLGRTPGAVGDYLSWLLGVDALRRERKRYYYVDRVLASWVRLYGRGRLPTEEALRAAAEEACAAEPLEGTELGPAAPPPRPEPAPESPGPSPPRRPDSLMEID